MSEPFFIDASILQIHDAAPVKATFLETVSDGHFFGFYTLENNAPADARTLFANVGTSALIPNVSSVFLGNRLGGKTPVFFVIENGWDLNRGAPWFNDAAGGQNGFWKFLKPEENGLFPALEQGKTVWKNAGGLTVRPAVDATVETARPVLVWQANDGRIHVPKGKIYHSCAYGLHPELNPDGARRFVFTTQKESASVLLCYIDASIPPAKQKPLIAFRLQAGDGNFQALLRNRIATVLPVLPDDEKVLSASVEIPDEFEDALEIDGVADGRTVTVGQDTVSIEINANRLEIKGVARAALYTALLSRVKIKTDATAPAKSKVAATIETASGIVEGKGEVDILSEKAADRPSSPIIAKAAHTPPASISNYSALPAFYAETKSETLPSFLTQTETATVRNAPKSAAFNKTVLIAGGARGIGADIARALAARGGAVIVHCHADVADAAKLVEELRRAGHGKAAYVRADFNSVDETGGLIDDVTRTYGVPDLLVFAASADLPDSAAGGFDENVAVNLRAPFILTGAYARALPKGRVGNVLAVFKNNRTGFSSAALTKAATRELVALAGGTLADRVRVNALALSGYDASARGRLIDAVCFLAQNPLVSGQVLELGSQPSASAGK